MGRRTLTGSLYRAARISATGRAVRTGHAGRRAKNARDQTPALLTEALGLSADTDEAALALASEQLDELAPLLPEPDGMTIEGACLLLLAGDALFTLAREEQQLVVYRTRVSRVVKIRYKRNEDQTSWDFHFRHGDQLHVHGRIAKRRSDEPEEFVRGLEAEKFARGLAEHAGWSGASPS